MTVVKTFKRLMALRALASDPAQDTLSLSSSRGHPYVSERVG